MTNYPGSSRKHFTPLFVFLLFSAHFLLLPMHTMAQKRPTRVMDRPETRVSLIRPSFTYSPSSPTAGQEVQFKDTSRGSLASWQWDFGDGTISTDQNPSHTFSAPGSFRVKLTAGDRSASREVTRAINVLSSASITSPGSDTSFSVGAVSFTYAPASLVAGSRVQFTDTSTNSPTSWLWDFGDGGASSIQNPSYTYRVAGSYAVTLTTKSGSNSSSVCKNVTIHANIIAAASPSLADVNVAIARANSGDTVIVPAGAATWDSNLIITKGINLIGAGIGNTVITGNYTNSDDSFSNSAYLVVYNPPSPALNEPFRLSGFTINCANKSRPLLVKNNSVPFINNVRIDHNRILGGYLHYVIQIKGHVWGVADNNILDGCYISVDFMDDTTWNNYEFQFGTANAFYFEDNTMVGRDGYLIIRSEMGAMWCSRHNVYDGSNMTTGLYPWHDMHGNLPNAHNAAMGVEIYDNVLTNPLPADCAIVLHQRGGKALFFNNTVNMAFAYGPRVQEEYLDSANPPATSPIDGQPQHVSDSYYWGNRLNGTARIAAYVDAGESLNYGGSIGIVPRANVHFWDENPAFDGTSGVGVGLLSARPSTCTTGVAYWATDTKTLYQATATNVWTVYYRPYTYPHPLRSD